MERYKQFDRLVINDFVAEVWQHPLHNHNHYEFIFIVEGKGMHHINKRLLPYRKGSMYLLGPEDEHEFMIDEKTRFVYFKFTKLYLDTFKNEDASEWNQDIDSIISLKASKTGDLLKSDDDIEMITLLLNLIVKEYQKNEVLSKKIVFQLFKSIMLVIKRNKHSCGTKMITSENAETTEDLLEYIELNIYNPKMLTQKQIAAHFHYSPNYIGTFFKEKVGTSLKNYIQQYRFNLLEQRLKHGQSSTKQLALEFGFTDESHLHKFVKIQSGKKLTAIKQEM
ncbi:AraC family transcriptional regulator [Mangrovimonas sp. ST2L15]|uniref:AraC family transcriptional regulator n=1 Tax=Mangrovimonas sp. ST2L15 TaxID=1645916 RepID=UPI0006B434C3|nr:AraC family transcriptional regulator [Mangrovimonas sp. ST2L15]